MTWLTPVPRGTIGVLFPVGTLVEGSVGGFCRPNIWLLVSVSFVALIFDGQNI